MARSLDFARRSPADGGASRTKAAHSLPAVLRIEPRVILMIDPKSFINRPSIQCKAIGGLIDAHEKAIGAVRSADAGEPRKIAALTPQRQACSVVT